MRRWGGSRRGWSLVLAGLLAGSGGVVHGAAKPGQPTPAQIVNQFQHNEGVFPGYRRNHAKGVCIAGYFQSNGAAARYSMARAFARGQRTPILGRLSIPGTSPYAWDGSTPIRGMALVFEGPAGDEWRTAMNGVPAFPVATPAADYAFMRLQQPNPATGDPDPAPLAAFFATHPRANAFRRWDANTPPPPSYAVVRYNSLDAFWLVDAAGQRRAVRWSMVPDAAAGPAHAPRDDPDYLDQDLRRRLAHGAIKWRLVFTFAAPGDAIDDASVPWPADRRHVVAGTLVIDASQPQRNGPCRDVNFDPLVLPRGIEPSDDPLLKFRQEVYAASHRRRIEDPHRLPHTPATARSAGVR